LGGDNTETVLAVLMGDDHELIAKVISAHDDIVDTASPALQ
jgi:hypothetical protein